MKNTDWNKWAKYALLGLLGVVSLFVVVIPAVEVVGTAAGDFLIAYVDKHPVGVFILVCICGVVGWIAYQSYTNQPDESERGKPRKPTETDYFCVLQTVRPALAEVADALGLAPITSHTDLAVDPDERILTNGDQYWGLVYKAKKLPNATFDRDLFMRVLQAQIKTVLIRDNPSRLDKIWSNNGGTLEPIFQVDYAEDGDVFIRIYIVIASDAYWRQKRYDRERENIIKTDTTADDTDF